jgi:hypothetical protein
MEAGADKHDDHVSQDVYLAWDFDPTRGRCHYFEIPFFLLLSSSVYGSSFNKLVTYKFVSDCSHS